MTRPTIQRESVVYSTGSHVWEHVCTECGTLVAVTTVGANERPVYDECLCTIPLVDRTEDDDV